MKRRQVIQLELKLLYNIYLSLIVIYVFKDINPNMSLSPRLYTQAARLPRELITACSITIATRSFSVLHRPAPNYPGHVPLTSIERGGLAIGSAVMAFFNPYRAGMNWHFKIVFALTNTEN